MHYMLVGFCRWPAAGAAHKLLLLLHLFTDLRVSTELHTAFKYEHIFGKQLPWYKILTDVWNSYNRYVEDFFFFQGGDGDRSGGRSRGPGNVFKKKK